VSEPRPPVQPRWFRPALAGAVLLVTLLTLALNNCWCNDRWSARVLLVSVVVVAWIFELSTQRLPIIVFTVSVTVPVGWLIFTDNGSVSALYLLLLVGWVMYKGPLRTGLVATGLSILAILGYAHFDSPDRWLPWIMGTCATALMIRLLVAQQSLVQELRAAQADLARQATAAERRRIAGEIHDLAAHSLAVTLLHLTGARLRVQREQGQAWLVDALGEAERMGRQSLDDVRRTVGLLQDSSNGTLPPLPGAAQIPGLVAEFRAAGLDVSLVVAGEPAAIAPATGLALYRIAQEALANVVKHAPGAAVQVALDYGPETRLRVRNPVTAAGPLATDGGTGLGLGGMCERARLVGGWVRAGQDEAGWLVECVIPDGVRA
jgi:signal transduction histidine kinase